MFPHLEHCNFAKFSWDIQILFEQSESTKFSTLSEVEGLYFKLSFESAKPYVEQRWKILICLFNFSARAEKLNIGATSRIRTEDLLFTKQLL